MTYRETLKKAIRLGISVSDLVIANECDCVFDFEYTNEEFEQLCKKAHECYLKAEDITEYSLALAINDLIKEKDFSVQEVLDMDKWELIDKASYYI
jgi:hypothetical protein